MGQSSKLEDYIARQITMNVSVNFIILFWLYTSNDNIAGQIKIEVSVYFIIRTLAISFCEII